MHDGGESKAKRMAVCGFSQSMERVLNACQFSVGWARMLRCYTLEMHCRVMKEGIIRARAVPSMKFG